MMQLFSAENMRTGTIRLALEKRHFGNLTDNSCSVYVCVLLSLLLSRVARQCIMQ